MLRDFFATSFDYCNVYSTNSTLYCLTDNPSEVKQPDVMMPATTYPVEPAFPSLNLNDPALLTDPNWRNQYVAIISLYTRLLQFEILRYKKQIRKAISDECLVLLIWPFVSSIKYCG